MLPSLLLRLCSLKMGYAVHPVFFMKIDVDVDVEVVDDDDDVIDD
jgi:hypothetical protein